MSKPIQSTCAIERLRFTKMRRWRGKLAAVRGASPSIGSVSCSGMASGGPALAAQEEAQALRDVRRGGGTASLFYPSAAHGLGALERHPLPQSGAAGIGWRDDGSVFLRSITARLGV